MYQCKNCGGDLKFRVSTQMLSCESCESEFSPYDLSREKDAEHPDYYETNVFRCPQCGAELLSENQSIVGECSFCGSSSFLEAKVKAQKRPESIIPFQITEVGCKEEYQKRIKRALYAPGKIRDESFMNRVRGIYMPYYDYEMEANQENLQTYVYTTETTPNYIIKKHYSYIGDLDEEDRGISFDASTTFPDYLSDNIAPYQLDEKKPFTPAYLCGFYGDAPDLEKEDYEESAKELQSLLVVDQIKDLVKLEGYQMDDNERIRVSKAIPGTVKKANLSLFPVWFCYYKMRDRIVYGVMNGQTGKFSMDIPISLGKYLLFSLLTTFVLFGMSLLTNFTMMPRTTVFASMILCLVTFLIQASDLKKLRARDLQEDDLGNLIGKARKDGKTVLKKKATMGYSDEGEEGNKNAFVRFKRNSNVIRYVFSYGILVYVLYRFSSEISRFGTGSGSGFLAGMIDQINILSLACFIGCFIIYSRIAKTIGNLKSMPKRIGIHVQFLASAASLIMVITDPAEDRILYGTALVMLICLVWGIGNFFEYNNRIATKPIPQIKV